MIIPQMGLKLFW